MSQGDAPLAEQFEEALEDAWDEWEWGDDDSVVAAPSCDLENPEVCESCQ